MKRAAVFAHYDKDSIVDDYVIYYIENLKKIADIVIFVSCNNLSEEEKMKLDVNYIISEEHKEYDFGSYKRGFLYLKENNLLNDIDELIFANDSCYAPLFPFEEMFEKMEKEQCDFWGVTKNSYGIIKNGPAKYKRVIRPHCQSYFILFKSKVFLSKCFFDFINNIGCETQKNDIIIKYEIGLSEFLCENGFSYTSYIKNKKRYNNVTIFRYRNIIKENQCPFLKCSIPRGNIWGEIINAYSWKAVLYKYTNYPIQLIEQNLKRTAVYKNTKALPFKNFVKYIYSQGRFIIVCCKIFIKNVLHILGLYQND